MMIRSLLRTGAITLALVVPLSFLSAQSSSSTGSYFFQSARDQGRLGVSIQDVTAELKVKQNLSVDHGAYVIDVEEESPAEKAEIKKGDVIIRFDGEEIESSRDLTKLVKRTKPKRSVPVEIVRKKEHKVVTATIGHEPGIRAFSFDFGGRNFHYMPRMPRIPHIPRIPHGLGMIHRDEGMGELFGLEVEELTKQLAEYFEVPDGKGVLVTEVERGTAADTAGFKAGDVILKAGGNSVRDIGDLRDEFLNSKKEEIPVEIRRKGKPLTLSLKLDRDKDTEGEDEGMSGSSQIRGLGQRWNHDREPGYHEFTARTMEALKEFIRKFKTELKNGLQDLREDLQTHFSKL